MPGSKGWTAEISVTDYQDWNTPLPVIIVNVELTQQSHSKHPVPVKKSVPSLNSQSQLTRQTMQLSMRSIPSKSSSAEPSARSMVTARRMGVPSSIYSSADTVSTSFKPWLLLKSLSSSRTACSAFAYSQKTYACTQDRDSALCVD